MAAKANKANKASKPTLYQGPGWQMLLAPDWLCEFIDDCFTVYQPDGVGVMQISVFAKEGEVTSDDLRGLADEQLEDIEILNDCTTKGFFGFSTSFDEDDEFWQCWFLGCEDTALFITYNCEAADRNAEISHVREMVKSLDIEQ